MNSIVQKIKSIVVLISLLFLTGGIGAWAQTDYSGTYYIANNAGGAYSAGANTNFYMVPAQDPQQDNYSDAYYSANYALAKGDPEKPFITTYKTERDNNSIWQIVSSGDGYYYIKHWQSGKYLIYKSVYTGGDAHRKAVHLVATDTPDSYDSKFDIKVVSGSALSIRPISLTGGNRFLNPAGGNKETYYGQNTSLFYGGIVGVYNSASDGNSKWYLETAILPPTFSVGSSGDVTITAEAGTTIYYTTNGDTPTTSDTEYTDAITPATGMTVIKAIVAKGGNSSNVASLPLHTYTYYIVNRDSIIAVKKEVVQSEGKSLGTVDDIPADIRSSYLADESASFYTFSGAYDKDKLTDENGIEATPSADAPIYVTYTTDHLSDKFLRLRGARAFNIKRISDNYCAYDNSGSLGSLSYDDDDSNNTLPSHMWNIGGSEDPYDVEITNVGTGNYMVFSTPPTLALDDTTPTKFIIMAGSADGDGSTYEQVKLMKATGTGANDFSKAEIKAYNVNLSFTYKLIDRKGKLIESISSNESELKLPDEWISPLVSTYRFYKTASVAGDGTYTLSNPVTSPFAVESGQPIYVNYDVSNVIDITGGKTYMLRYLYGQNFKQEDGHDVIMSEESKAEYPYNNGDFNLYVYGKHQWDEQLVKGASTRSRWLWYIISNHNGTDLTGADVDPYHVIVKSYQEQLIKAQKGAESEHKFIGHNYLRTYKPEGYASVVTGVSYENAEYNQYYSGIMPASRVDGNPTEYMLTGTSLDKVKLVTLDAIDDGTTNERRTVNSFEQYWKTFDTVKKNMYGSSSTDESEPATIPADAKAKYGSSTSMLLRDSLEDIGWHSYSKWANAKRWNGRNAQGDLNKGLESIEHWFQTIDMGSGEFVFEEVSLEPQVILLDNHGWEIARVPLYTNYKEAGQAVNTAGLNAYNSPMVEQYHWYSTSVKATGYHKFTVSGDAYHDSSSLSDIPTGMEAGKEPDFYVTYDVKARYANAYKGAAKAADTKASAYLLKQGGKYAKTSGSIIEKADDPASIETADETLQWYLKPNFDIDREMGYRYAGESGAQDEAKTKDETEQDYYIAGKNGFDPYNVQIQSKYNTSRYFTANSSDITLSGGYWSGSSSQISLQNLNVKQHASGYDQTTLNITNATFMVVSDANGNMRLMPRFDNTKVANSDGESNPFTVLATQHAAAAASDRGTDTQTLWLDLVPAPTEVHSSSEITEMNGHYLLAEDFSFASGFTSLGTSSEPFTGTIDGQYHTFDCPGTPLVAYADGAVIRNLMLDDVDIDSGNENGNVGAICNEATGATRIYNCGILATGSTVSTDENGYTHITSCSSSVSGTKYVGGLVGLLDGESRVINCFSYANVSGGTHVGGIVGYNNVVTTARNLKTMVMNCMFYGEVSGDSIAPIYHGYIITNVGDSTGVSNFNYFRLESAYIQNTAINKKYNCALGAETRFLQRFEFFRHLQNSHRELAAWWATGDYANKDDMAKWVLLPSQIGTSTPYPVLAKTGYYPSVVNIDADNAPDSVSVGRNKGGKQGELAVTIQMGSGAVYGPPAGAEIIYPSLTLNITDKDPDHFNFNYYKVQLPYYNDVGTKNYTGNRVVTGWKIVGITGGTAGTYEEKDSVGGYNFADRHCTNKDLYSTSHRVFNQGAYWDVPEGVTAITIEPYWALAAYAADENADMVYNTDMSTAYKVPYVGGGKKYNNGSSYSIAGSSQRVFTSIKSAVESSNGLNKPTENTVNDYAVVLVGNVHQVTNNNSAVGSSYNYTVTSIDLDGDDEPDYSLVLRNNGRNVWHPVKWDFINIPGLGMAQKSTGGTGSYNLGIVVPKYWFETTNTSLFRVTQFEYSRKSNRNAVAAPYILQSGVIEQWVTGQNNVGEDPMMTSYFHLGGNVWFKEFHRGTHQDNTGNTNHPPVSVTGGDFDEFYLTGLYRGDVTSYADNAECYINGGRFGTVAGAAMEGIGAADGAGNTGNIYWQIQNADIKEFYGGGLNAARPVTGNISTTITGGKIDLFCGGPKFGDMSTGKTVTTTAAYCEFGTFFGAGFGGSSYSRRAPQNVTNMMNMPATTKDNKSYDSWNAWVRGEYKQQKSGADFPGISTRFNYQFIPNSGNADNVGRLFVEHILFSKAKCRDITSTLTNCKITGNFYGGGSLGMVDGPAASTLTDCTVDGNVFGGGYSASLPTVEVDSIGFRVEPYYYTDLGTYRMGVKGKTTTYKWAHGSTNSINTTDSILYTTEVLEGLGSVTGNVTLTINGTTTVGKSVYGGGEESAVNGNTTVTVNGGTVGTQGTDTWGAVYGNVYGGGMGMEDDAKAGLVKGNTNVIINQEEGKTTTILHNIYGGGAFGSVGTFTTDADNMPTAVADDTGKATVTVNGGTIGTTGKDNGMVFGSSRGDVGIPDASGIDPNDSLAWVSETHVIIGDAALETTPLIKGSVYGSGENGHTLKNTLVEVHKGIVGIDDNEDADGGARHPYRGNVYGGGCGTDTYESGGKTYYNFLAGIVKGNTTVNIDGGKVVHNVYGAGSMGSVGTYTFDSDDSNDIPDGKPTTCVDTLGLCTVNISGGEIGVNGVAMPDDLGHVFGAGRGASKDPALYPNVEISGYVNKTAVTISGTAFVRGSVYGGSENGHVLSDTEVNVSGGQIGCGTNVNRVYTAEEWTTADPANFATCASWTYTDNGKPYDIYDLVGTTPKPATDGHTFYGNVFGGGSGYFPYGQNPNLTPAMVEAGYSDGLWLETAGRVEGNSVVNITGGHILSNVYGGCETTNVQGTSTVTMSGGTVGVPQAAATCNPALGHLFGAGKGDKRINFNTWTDVGQTTVTISGGRVFGSVYGGGEDGHVKALTAGDGSSTVTISGATTHIGCGGTTGYDGNVFGAGQGSVTALTAGVVQGNVALTITGGQMDGSVYGGGRLASVGTYLVPVDDVNYGKMLDDDAHGNINVSLTGGTINQNVFAGGMGTKLNERLGISRNDTLHLNKDVASDAKGCVVHGYIFGCNNANASPTRHSLVHIHATQNASTMNISTKLDGFYDVKGVFGGGNEADYKPIAADALKSTEVIIDGCDLTSIDEVYGGGYGAATPATSVLVRGTKIINNVFGGGYGAGDDNPGANVGFYTNSTDESDYPGASGKAVVKLMAGHINNVFGGSNTKGDIKGGSSITNVTKDEGDVGPACCDALDVNNIYGGGKDAPMYGGAEIVLGCMPNDWISEIYAGAENADIGNDVSLTLTSGKFGRVFGGNKAGGKLDGSIEVNIEENATCGTPIIIGELYGGGNLAPYSIYGYNDDGSVREEAQSGVTPHNSPRVNVRAFTSIGNIYGGGLGVAAVVVGSPTVNIQEVAFDTTIDDYESNAYDPAVVDASRPAWLIDKDYAGDRTGKVVLYPHVDGKMGVIGNVFGGGNAAQVVGDTNVKIATDATTPFTSLIDPEEALEEEYVVPTQEVVGADIRGNVYGGGNLAEVTGNTNVVIGKKNVPSPAP